MKNQTLLSSRSETRRASARSLVRERGGYWPSVLLAVCCTLLIALAHPARAAVTVAWVDRYNNCVMVDSDDRAANAVRDAAGESTHALKTTLAEMAPL